LLLTMRAGFAMQDKCGFRGGDTNLRRYVHNNPTNLVDPSGLAAWTQEEVRGIKINVGDTRRDIYQGKEQVDRLVEYVKKNLMTGVFANAKEVRMHKAEEIVRALAETDMANNHFGSYQEFLNEVRLRERVVYYAEQLYHRNHGYDRKLFNPDPKAKVQT